MITQVVLPLLAAVAFGAPQHLIAPYAIHAPVVAAPAPSVVETKVHYVEKPVVVGHSAQILKPALAAPFAPVAVAAPAVKTVPFAYPYFGAPLAFGAPVATEEKKITKRSADEKTEAEPKALTVPLAYAAHPFIGAPLAYPAPIAAAPVSYSAPVAAAPVAYTAHVAAPVAYAAPAVAYSTYTTPLAHTLPVDVPAPAVVDIKAPVPAGDAPSMDVLVTKEKVLAPVRATQTITPQVTVQHPTKVNVEKVAVEVPVAQPYAHPVPVAVAPQYEIHQYHAAHPAVAVVA